MKSIAPSSGMLELYDAELHYGAKAYAPVLPQHDEVEIDIRNIGWTLGNDCPYRCTHCYSMSARRKGANFNRDYVDRIVDQLKKNGIETVNLGGNEPIFTNGMDVKKSLLPYIIRRLNESRILVGLTTSGITLKMLERHYSEVLELLNDCDISFDSADEELHNQNRGAPVFQDAIDALTICDRYNIDRSVIMCGMSWNFNVASLERLVSLACRYSANIRINPIKTVEPKHVGLKLSPEQYYRGFEYLMKVCDPLDLGEPPIATVCSSNGRGCPCGRTSFRIHSITPDGQIPVSPCVYLHDFKVGDLLKDELYDIVRTEQFRDFRRRNAHPDLVRGCEGCELIKTCRGGCAARSYLTAIHNLERQNPFLAKDPYCPKEHGIGFEFPEIGQIQTDTRLVHQDYLCTWIGRAKRCAP